MAKYAFYLGCNTPLVVPDIEKAIRVTMPRLGVDLVDMQKTTCCPTPGAYSSFDKIAGLVLSARNLSIAEEMGLDIVTPCNGCFGVLKHSRETLLKHQELHDKINELLKSVDREFKGSIDVHHVMHVLNDIGPKKIADGIDRNLEGFKISIQVGCHQLRPSDVLQGDDPERPHQLRELLQALGAEVPYYSKEMQCCGGGGLRATSLERSTQALQMKLDSMIEEVNPDFIVTPCNSCLTQIDTAQARLRKQFDGRYSFPVLYVSQILALLMGFAPENVASIAETPRDTIIKRIRGNGHG